MILYSLKKNSLDEVNLFPFKLEKEIVIRRTKRLEDSGVEFNLNFNVGKDKTFEELRKNHDNEIIMVDLENIAFFKKIISIKILYFFKSSNNISVNSFFFTIFNFSP